MSSSAKRSTCSVRGRRSYKVSRTTTQSGELIAHNEDLMLQILIRLPVKSLIRFKCVSKLWNSLISSPQFAHNYTLSKLKRLAPGLIINPNKHNARGGKYASLGDAAVSDKSLHCLKFLNATQRSYLTILGTCNGLSLCRCGSKSWQASRDPNVTYYVCNLATKKFKVLPPSSEPVENHSQFSALSFDPFTSPHYKVACVRYTGHEIGAAADNGKVCDVEIYSSKTGSWGAVKQHIVPQIFMLIRAPSIAWNGWVFCGYSNSELERTCCYIDIENECMSTINLPSCRYHSRTDPPNLQICNSCLLLIDFNVGLTTHINVYEMERDAGSWFLRYKVINSQLVQAFSQIRTKFYRREDFVKNMSVVVRGQHEEEEEEEEEEVIGLLIVKLCDKVICFDLEDVMLYPKVLVKRKALQSSSGLGLHVHFETLSQP